MKTVSITLVAVAALAGASCTPMVDVRGNLPMPEQLALVKPGTTTRDEVQSLLGTPSTTMAYGDETWQYISSRTETTAFFTPELKERKVVSIDFDKNGIVRNIRNLGIDDGQDVKPIERETITAGKHLTVLEQLVGNIGRFSKSPGGK